MNTFWIYMLLNQAWLIVAVSSNTMSAFIISALWGIGAGVIGLLELKTN